MSHLLDEGNDTEEDRNDGLNGVALEGVDGDTVGLEAQGQGDQGAHGQRVHGIETGAAQFEHGAGHGRDESLELEQVSSHKGSEL